MATRYIALAIAVMLVVLLAFGTGLLLIPTSAAASEFIRHDGVGIQSLPPAQVTLQLQTPDLSGLPPIDLGSLLATSTPSPTSIKGITQVVIENAYDSCEPIVDDFIDVRCENGQLAFTRKETSGTRWIYYRPVLTDTVIEVTARLPSNRNAQYGVIFRLDSDGRNFYLFGVTNQGRYGLFRFAENHYETLIPYTPSPFVGSAGLPSEIKLVNQGDVIAINVGGSWLDSVREPTLKEGRVALFVEATEPNQTVLFDNLRVSTILSPIALPEPRTPGPATPEGITLPILTGEKTATLTAAPPTQTPIIIIIVTATPLPATRPPTPLPTSTPECPAGPNEAILYISNNYIGYTMRFTIGGGEWGTHDYDVPGDGKWYLIRMPPGTYTYTAHIAGIGKANGERKAYLAGQCYSLRFSP